MIWSEGAEQPFVLLRPPGGHFPRLVSNFLIDYRAHQEDAFLYTSSFVLLCTFLSYTSFSSILPLYFFFQYTSIILLLPLYLFFHYTSSSFVLLPYFLLSYFLFYTSFSILQNLHTKVSDVIPAPLRTGALNPAEQLPENTPRGMLTCRRVCLMRTAVQLSRSLQALAPSTHVWLCTDSCRCGWCCFW